MIINLGSHNDKFGDCCFDPRDGTPAAWIYDGEIEIGGEGDATSHRLSDGKQTVPCFDFSQWLAKLDRPKDDEIIVKMDIEGAEYEVLPKMLEDGTISLVQELIIEWHDWKVGVEKVETKRLTALIKQAGVRILRWK